VIVMIVECTVAFSIIGLLVDAQLAHANRRLAGPAGLREAAAITGVFL
jgi:hypothetical protein